MHAKECYLEVRGVIFDHTSEKGIISYFVCIRDVSDTVLLQRQYLVQVEDVAQPCTELFRGGSGTGKVNKNVCDDYFNGPAWSQNIAHKLEEGQKTEADSYLVTYK